jgi:hypothetical protein
VCVCVCVYVCMCVWVCGAGTLQEVRDFTAWFDSQPFPHRVFIAGTSLTRLLTRLLTHCLHFNACDLSVHREPRHITRH